ncbi:MAG: type II toxin-antitoxin system VapC family toxin [bacterium]|nr:type II toxin-antitoxin system VapC family toxin [bacterium]
MRLLLDTHAFIWSLVNRSKLSARALDAISDAENEVLASAVAAYEIEYKRPRDVELQRMPTDLNQAVKVQGFSWVGISWEDARDAARLPLIHRDPWDRLLVAQAERHSARLVTRDPWIASYNVTTLW